MINHETNCLKQYSVVISKEAKERLKEAAFALGVSVKVFSDSLAAVCNVFEQSSQEMRQLDEAISRLEKASRPSRREYRTANSRFHYGKHYYSSQHKKKIITKKKTPKGASTIQRSIRGNF